MSEFPFCDHSAYSHLRSLYTERERRALFWGQLVVCERMQWCVCMCACTCIYTCMHTGVGWREDTVGHVDNKSPEADPSITCSCGKCSCITKHDPSGGTSNGRWLTETQVAALSASTEAQISEKKAAPGKLNMGLWSRCHMFKVFGIWYLVFGIWVCQQNNYTCFLFLPRVLIQQKAILSQFP